MTRKLEFYIPLAILVLGTVAALVTNIDIETASWFFSPDAKHKFLTKHPIVAFGNQWGPKVSMTFALLALMGLILSFANPKYIKHRAVLYFIALSYLLGPALLVNGILKETVQRPRPREITEFGGNREFVKVLVPGPRKFHGKSFPSGHGSAGYVLVLFYFLLKRKSKTLSLSALLLALSFGTYISIARTASGAHFFSDNLWAFGICWFVPYFLYYRWYLKYREKPIIEFKKSKLRMTLVLGGASSLVLFLFLPFLLSDEFHEDYGEFAIPIPPNTKHVVISGTVKKGNAHLYPVYGRSKNNIYIRSDADGRAFPGIGIHLNYETEKKGDTLYLQLEIKPKGYYLRYLSHTQVLVPEKIPVSWNLKVLNGLTLFKRGNYTIGTNK